MSYEALKRLAVMSVGLAGSVGAACGAAGGLPSDPDDPFVPEPAREAQPLAIEAIDKIDVLFVIDDSGSMREEQRALAEQFPRMARVLTSGDLDGDGTADFPPPADVQFGVISPDLGLPGVSNVEHCSGVGDDGLLRVPSRAPSDECGPDLPAFVRYRQGESDPDVVARELACLAQLGTDGCGFEQPLEAALKALWPGGDGRVTFLGLEGQVTGHGTGANAGFARAEPGTTPSLLVIVLMTDEDDCSATDRSIFLPPDLLDPQSDLAAQGLNLRCFHNPDRLYRIDRYARGLSFLREGAPQLVMFAAITGVPVDRVDATALADLDYTDPEARDAFYDELLADPRMQQRLDESRSPAETLVPACESPRAKAYPARRIVQVAKAFGENGLVQSVCQDDPGQVLGFVLARIAHRMRHPQPHPQPEIPSGFEP